MVFDMLKVSVNVLKEVKMVTIKDIAKQAGVSYATVSRALNNHTEINIETRKKVLRIAKEAGYQPNAIARGLVKKETQTLGLLIPDIINPFFAEVARWIEDTAIENGYTIFLCNTNWSLERESNYLNVLRQKQVDGILIAPASEKIEHLKKILSQWSKNIVAITRMNISNVTSVLIDNVQGARMAVEHLIGRGHRRIAFIGGLIDISANQERLQGYQEALAVNGIEPNRDYIVSGDFKRESGHQIMHKLLNLKERPDAVFAANDLLALGAIQAIREAGLTIPGDMAVSGFDDIEFAALPEIQLTTVSQPKYEMGKLALLTLINQIKNEEKTVAKKIMLEPTLIVRKTT
jgi:LacI family transcriptional regulator